jgi:hypothetical protein
MTRVVDEANFRKKTWRKLLFFNEEENPDRFRKPLLYPLSYGGKKFFEIKLFPDIRYTIYEKSRKISYVVYRISCTRYPLLIARLTPLPFLVIILKA